MSQIELDLFNEPSKRPNFDRLKSSFKFVGKTDFYKIWEWSYRKKLDAKALPESADVQMYDKCTPEIEIEIEIEIEKEGEKTFPFFCVSCKFLLDIQYGVQ